MSTNRIGGHTVFYGMSDRGLQRENNEDHFIVADLTRQVIGVNNNEVDSELLQHEIGERGFIFAVADGLGGHEGGEVASRLAVEVTVQTLFTPESHGRLLTDHLIEAVEAAHEAICRYHGDDNGGARRMASTLTIIHVDYDTLTIVHVGDSRAYRFDAGKLTLLTEDQTVVHMMQKKGLLTDEEARTHPHRNVILQALGQGKAVAPTIETMSWQDGDRLLLCSDGLSSYVTHEDITAILAAESDPRVCCTRLVETANAAGGADNITVLMVQLHMPSLLQPLVHDDDVVEELVTEAEPAPKNVFQRDLGEVFSGLSRRWLRKTKDHSVVPPENIEAIAEPEADEKKSSLGEKFVKRRRSHEDNANAKPEEIPVFTPEQQPTARNSPFLNIFTNRKPNPTPAWDAQVLRALEDIMAEYVGPVAKILVLRAAGQTRDIDELLQLLAVQLPTEQEKQKFLQTFQSQ